MEGVCSLRKEQNVWKGSKSRSLESVVKNNQFGNMVNSEIIQNVQNVTATSKSEQ